MDRTILHYLQKWLLSADRKPLVVRGARQVGKTWIVRHFAQLSGKQLIELNFEKHPSHVSLFTANDPRQILLNLSVLQGKDIVPENSLLFLDEIQAAPQILAKLRWFAEDLPTLPVVAAGSLLEFVLAEHSFSMPVGRISYVHLEPLSFEEFLLANDKKSLSEYLKNYEFNNDVPVAIHEALSDLFKEYVLVGGMPAAVSNWASERSLNKVNQIQHDLLATYRDDFAKYHGRIAIDKLDETLRAVPKMLGEKFVYKHVNADVQTPTIKRILDLFSKARICHRVACTAANGVPLGAEINDKRFKEIFLDTGLCSVLLGLNLTEINAAQEIDLINKGGIAEQAVGQQLRTLAPAYIEPSLYYWARDEQNANAEIDYVIQHASKIIPIEVKAGSTGTLKSLHFFMDLKKLGLAVRISSFFSSKMQVKTKNHAGKLIQYTLLSLPFYLLGQLPRLLDKEMSSGNQEIGEKESS